MKFLTQTFLIVLISSEAFSQSKEIPVILGEKWNDTKGRPINAHGAGILYYKGVYYLFGEIKKGKTLN